MRATTQLLAAHLDTVGAASIAQGVYGAHGNLEAVVADAHDGLQVLWCNADPVGSAFDDVVPGAWSRGLRFAEGARWIGAEIAQSTLGPDHLEVLALAASGDVVSWWWSPGPGFQARPGVVASGVVDVVLAHADGVLTASVVDADGLVRHLRSDGAGYPNRSWTVVDAGPSLAREDATAALAAAGVPAADVEPGTARASRSTRDGGTTELTYRHVDGALRHVALRDG